MKRDRRTILLFNYRAGAAEPGFGEDDAAMVLAPHALKAYIGRNGRRDVDVKLLICNRNEPAESVLRKVYELSPDVAGFGCYVWNFQDTLNLTRRLRLVLPKTKTILGGPETGDEKYSTDIMEENPWIDAVIRGEGETPLEMFLDDSFSRRKIPGLTFREKGAVVSNPGAPIFPDPAMIPSFYTPDFVRDMPVVYYSSARGCAGRCRYCREWSLKRNLPLDRVERDLKIIFGNGDMKLFGFIDSVLDDDTERLYEILEITARLNKRRVPISAYFYFRETEPRLFDLLEQAGFKYLRVGIESRNPETLRRVGRGEKNLSHIDNVLPYRDRFTIVPYIISHLPGETSESFRENVITCFRKGLLQLDFHCNRLDVFPGTHLYRHSSEEGYTFDERPPHHVYTSRGWTYEQFIADRNFLRNVMVLGRIFTPADEASLSFNGLGLFEIAETIHKIFPEWKTAFRALSSDTISDVVLNENLPFLFAGYAEKAVQNRKARDAFVRLFMIRYFSYIASRVPETNAGGKEFNGEITLESSYFLPFFHRIKPGPDVLLFDKNPRMRFENLPESENSIFIFGGFQSPGAQILTTGDEDVAERFLNVLSGNQGVKLTTSGMMRLIEPDDRERFISLAGYLRDRRALLECPGSKRLTGAEKKWNKKKYEEA